MTAADRPAGSSGARGWPRCLAAAALALFVCGAARADDLLVERKYRLHAREVTLDLEHHRSHAQGEAALTYDDLELRADALDADFSERTVSAAGDVCLQRGRERLFADAADYDLDDRAGVLTGARGQVQGLYFSARSLEVTPQQMTLSDGSFTTCDAAQPHYRVTAREIVLRPGERVTARRAGLWYGKRRLLTVPHWSQSLRRGQATSPVAPLAGFSRRDGAFAGLRYSLYPAPAVECRLQALYATSRGVRALARVATRHPWGEAALAVSRRDDLSQPDLGLFAPDARLSDLTLDRVPEAAVSLSPVPLGRWVTAGARVAAGHYREEPSGISASRGVADLYLRGRPLPIARGMTASPLFGLRGVRCSGGQDRSAVAYGVILDAQPSRNLGLRAGYLKRHAHGAGPFSFDALDLSRELSVGVTARLGPGWRMEALARRDLERGSLAAFDVGVTRVAHCLEYGLTWRKVGGEFGLRLGLAQAGPAAAGWEP